LIAVGAVACGDGDTSAPAGGPSAGDALSEVETLAGPSDVPFDQAHFKATHNSYTGGPRGSIREQLDRGVRFIELDVHDDGFATFGDFRVGHGWPDDEVDHGGGNPGGDTLGEWLGVLRAWSAAHPDHAPITVCIDAKDDFAENPSFADGGLDAFNERLLTAFGDDLLRASAIDTSWPTVQALAGRVLVVLSGDVDGRRGYLGDRGFDPAVAMNRRGQVVEAHAGADGHLWTWTGAYRLDGRVDWRHRARWGEGRTPAVAPDDDGWIVALYVAGDGDDPALFSRLGRLREDLQIEWWPPQPLGPQGSGRLPTVRFSDLVGGEVRALHRRPGAATNVRWSGRVNPALGAVEWSREAPVTAPGFGVDAISVGGRFVRVFTAAGDPPTLRYATDRIPGARIRLAQLAFVELQRGDGPDLEPTRRWFYAADARRAEWAARARAAGHIVRRWRFAADSEIAGEPANFPATDTPFKPWYLAHGLRIRAVR